MNAVIFQVRPASDAMYASSIEPWSHTSRQDGPAAAAPYDPLAFAVAEAHKRGLELHAWFNPFRALLKEDKFPAALNHISKTHPELIRRYGDQVWLDPGEPAVREYVLRVVMDVVRRYDVDGVQFDDYFIPIRKGLRRARDGLSRRRELAEIRWRFEPRRMAAAKHQSIRPRRLSKHQGRETVVKFGVSRSHLASAKSAGRPRPRRLAKLYADTRLWFANGGWTISRRNFTGPRIRRSKVFPCCSIGGRNKMCASGISGRDSTPPAPVKSGGRTKCAANCRHPPPVRRGRGNFYHLRNLIAIRRWPA